MIKQYRKMNKLTLKSLSEKTNIPVATVHWCERNESRKSPTTKKLIAYIKHQRAYEGVCKVYARPALVETKSSLSFFARLWRWIKC